jgi:hypothetical protein
MFDFYKDLYGKLGERYVERSDICFSFKKEDSLGECDFKRRKKMKLRIKVGSFA